MPKERHIPSQSPSTAEIIAARLKEHQFIIDPSSISQLAVTEAHSEIWLIPTPDAYKGQYPDELIGKLLPPTPESELECRVAEEVQDINASLRPKEQRKVRGVRSLIDIARGRARTTQSTEPPPPLVDSPIIIPPDGENPGLILMPRYPLKMVELLQQNPDKATYVSAFERLGQSLSLLHGRGIIHGDVKPSNAYAISEVYLGDFGNAELQGQEQLRSGVGTPPYVAPEIHWRMPQTEKSDVYSLGTTIYQMLTVDDPDLVDQPFPYDTYRNGDTDEEYIQKYTERAQNWVRAIYTSSSVSDVEGYFNTELRYNIKPPYSFTNPDDNPWHYQKIPLTNRLEQLGFTAEEMERLNTLLEAMVDVTPWQRPDADQALGELRSIFGQ